MIHFLENRVVEMRAEFALPVKPWRNPRPSYESRVPRAICPPTWYLGIVRTLRLLGSSH